MSEFTRLLITWGWLGLTAVGVWITAYMMFATRSDLRFLKAQHLNGVVEAQTKLAFWNAARAFVILFLLFGIGIISLLTPHVPSTRQQPATGPFNWAFVIFLYWVVITLDYSAFAVFRFRRNFISGRIQAQAMRQEDRLDNIESGIAQLHEDNLAQAQELIRADDEEVRKVRNQGKEET